jgi:hypothetical protein
LESNDRTKTGTEMPGAAPTRPKKPATPIPFLKRPALARGFVGFTALNFAAMQLVATLFLPNGLFAILAAGPALMIGLSDGPVAANQKEPPRYKRGGHWVSLFSLIAGSVVTRPAVWLIG